MSLFPTTLDILSPLTNPTLALRRNIRIRSSKLPPDFFGNLTNQPYNLSPHPRQYNPLESRDIHTPCFNSRKGEGVSNERNRYE